MSDTYPASFGDPGDLNMATAREIARSKDPIGDANLGYTDFKADNDLRAAWAFLGLDAYVQRTFSGGAHEEFETLIPDLISDLLHLCDATGVSTAYALSKAGRQYEEELRGDVP